MSEATKKSPGIDRLLENLFGCDRVESIKNNLCVICGGSAKEFNDSLSLKEYTISGMCQKCQDETFGEK